ncbi:MaoC family dehydratase [Thermoanaerobacter thermohydrosulfuricus]|jgi:3-hydroxybutyryl-CoA dehydratase|uniref:Acyl dehydratase n=1 Tax=Thermoanaerobacter thermohydrosulfuricus WC1 TaxID=1198630 RepID=M8CPF0_THETY|nr:MULTISPECIES: MaoC family dehydratase [Thermoanaerobacter]EGD52800.1 MaoC domain protein dehydratase [Thermoanaerobacter ethanolicus JW 200]EMT39025.1 Acyl dehydratase [Thermoanaerobacter thermohydrosulfuricus WC1]UZQ83544.1 MaoC family dehydratase [Thermoanaerobacter sp. RKWS2]SFE18246.1 3-hydroxybutyryl-CoA dehydratase [Thermoanaerobacter thermohydrosulfuricus]
MGKTINELKIGDKDYFEKTITETDVYLYAGITGDFNPAHINQVASEKTMFKGRIAHGMLTAGLISAVLGTKLPGPGTIYLGQELKFTKPVRIGDTIKAEVEVVEIIPEKNRVKLKTICTNQNNEVVLEGMATVLAPKE